MKIITHENLWWWGKSYTLILDNGKAMIEVSIDYPARRDMTLGVKADSIIDELSRIIEPQVTMHFTDPSRAVTIAPIDPLYQGEEITMLLMPMLVNEE